MPRRPRRRVDRPGLIHVAARSRASAEAFDELLEARREAKEEIMWRARFVAGRIGVLLLLTDVVTAAGMEAQYPASRRKTSAVGTVLTADSAAPPSRTGVTRQLVCRGGSGLQVVREHDRSPRNPRLVGVALRYQRGSQAVRLRYDDLGPGACSWSNGLREGPLEPGVVHFDLDREGSAWVPDPTTLQEYLNDPEHHWVFYVDDVTNVSVSHGSYRGLFSAGDKREGKSRTSVAAERQRTVELRCRGGSGLAFSRGAGTGANQIRMTLAYRGSQYPPGEYGTGLNPGTCAWVDRAGMVREPGRIEFTTAGNAQLKQIQSGSTVDRSSTAAERWPDAQTIPAYMTEWSHFWTFTVKVSAPETARTHGAWIAPTRPIVIPSPGNGPRDLTPQQPAVKDAARQPVSEVSTTVSGTAAAAGAAGGGASGALPTRSGAGTSAARDRHPGPAEAATGRLVEAPPTLVRVLADPVRNRLLIVFTARTNASPGVVFSRTQPVKDASSGRRSFPGGGSPMDVAPATAGAFRTEYQATSWIGGRSEAVSYHYIITVPGTPDAAEQQLTGQFTMQARTPPPPSDGIKAGGR
jgi:hypothetical protein